MYDISRGKLYTSDLFTFVLLAKGLKRHYRVLPAAQCYLKSTIINKKQNKTKRNITLIAHFTVDLGRIYG